jgi:sortase B
MKNILKEDWYNKEENLNVTLITEQGSYTYEVFAVYQIKVEDYYIKTQFDNDTEFKEFINTIKSRSIKNFETNVTEKDTILTLSTCSMTGRERVVLHAKKI